MLRYENCPILEASAQNKAIRISISFQEGVSDSLITQCKMTLKIQSPWVWLL